MFARHEAMQDRVVAEARAQAGKGLFEVSLEIPPDVTGERLILRAEGANDRERFEGAAVLELTPSR